MKYAKMAGGTPARKSRPTRGVWIEILILLVKEHRERKSRPTRGVWIEIQRSLCPLKFQAVTPHTGRVD